MAANITGQSSRIPSGQGQWANTPGPLSRGYQAAERCIADNPSSAAGIAFGAGVGIGLCVGLAIKSAIYDRRRAHQRVTERLGRQVLEALSSVLPESLSSRIH